MNTLDPVKRALRAWYNIRASDMTQEDNERLAKLFLDGRFHAWHCPRCKTWVYFGTIHADEWGDFQGVIQADYTSYPGDEETQSVRQRIMLCDDCRMKWPPIRLRNERTSADVGLIGRESTAPWNTHDYVPGPGEL